MFSSQPIGVSAVVPPSGLELFAFGLNRGRPFPSQTYPTGGQLGINDFLNRFAPAPVGKPGDFPTVPVRRTVGTAFAIKQGKLYGWGATWQGAMGNGLYNPSPSLLSNPTLGQINPSGSFFPSPVQIGSRTDWVHVACAQYANCGLTSAGKLYTWGWGGSVMGQPDNLKRSSPVQVGTDTNWARVGATFFSFHAVKTNGTLWSWGRNDWGQLGLGDTTPNRSSPTQVGAQTDWVYACGCYQSVIGIKTTGKIYTWGYNHLVGQLGLGDLIDRSSPVQVGTATDWVDIAPSVGGFFMLAQKSNGQLWGWGNNGTGALGLPGYNFYSSPVQVGAGTTWAKVVGNDASILARTTDGRLFATGTNFHGQLGLGDTVNRGSLTQIGTLNTWTDIAANYYGNFAMRTWT